MIYSFCNLSNKEVINVNNGEKLGYIDDAEICCKSAQIQCLIVFGRCRFFGLFGRQQDTIIPWNAIQIIGEDTILVCCESVTCRPHNKKRFF